MKTTLEIPDQLFRRAKSLAAEQGIPFRGLVTEALAEKVPIWRGVLEEASVLAVPVIVLGEYAFGLRVVRHRSRYEKWLEELLRDCRVLQLDQSTAEAYADIRGELKNAERPIPPNDIWIAALARQHSLPLISRDLRFDYVKRLKRVTWKAS